ncbi:ABC transporter substrate-binding protein [Streptomyces sp. NPDC050263]|uniref:ABC transporter substrate-binding protein n=1 Tax=Streptomyces sp. NPDC050263 TaxID=3155037 RepID=UPI003448D049
MRPQRTITALTMVAALCAAGCSTRGDSPGRGDSEPGEKAAATAGTVVASGDFGDLKNVCGPGDPSGSPAQGVTGKEIHVGVMSDVGLSKNTEFGDAAKAFTSWCNEAGGINGRKIVPTVRDTRMLEVRQRVDEACRADFALVGGGAGLDGLGVKDRLSCLLPDFPAQTVQHVNEGSELQLSIQAGGPSYFRYAGFYDWLIKEAYPHSADAVGIISGDSPVTRTSLDQRTEYFKARHVKLAYSDLYPTSGVTNWTPYAQAIKDKKVKGLVFMGDFTSLAKLEQELTAMNYKLDWIDANSNAYGPAFLELAGPRVLAAQNNLADVSGIHPMEKASSSPATQQVLDLFDRYAHGAKVTLPAVKAFSAWLLFAKSATACGEKLTRRCVHDAARKETAWTGGGIQAPVNVSVQDSPVKCMNIEKATPDGWQPADFAPNRGAYRCGIASYRFTGDYGEPGTLASVGKSLAELK